LGPLERANLNNVQITDLIDLPHLDKILSNLFITVIIYFSSPLGCSIHWNFMNLFFLYELGIAAQTFIAAAENVAPPVACHGHVLVIISLRCVLLVDHLFAHRVLAGSDDCNFLINHLGMIVEDIFMEALHFLFPGMWATIFFLPLTI
jgi:hypothetical protein